MAEWIMEENYNWSRLRRDPFWTCSICGGGKHIFGIESVESQPKICPDCGATMTNAKEVIIVDFPILEGKK